MQINLSDQIGILLLAVLIRTVELRWLMLKYACSVQLSFSSIPFNAFACPLHVSVDTKTIFSYVIKMVLLKEDN